MSVHWSIFQCIECRDGDSTGRIGGGFARYLCFRPTESRRPHTDSHHIPSGLPETAEPNIRAAPDTVTGPRDPKRPFFFLVIPNATTTIGSALTLYLSQLRLARQRSLEDTIRIPTVNYDDTLGIPYILFVGYLQISRPTLDTDGKFVHFIVSLIADDDDEIVSALIFDPSSYWIHSTRFIVKYVLK